MDNKESNNPRNNEKQNNEKKIVYILQSIAQLFQPFKEVILNILPSFKWVINCLDFIGRSISKLILFIVRIVPLAVSFLKGKAFKIIVIVVLLLIVANTIASRIINTTSYKNILAKAIDEATGYHTVIEGRVSVNLLLLAVSIQNAGFYSAINKNSDVSLNLLTVNHLNINFSFLSLFLGKLKPKSVYVNTAKIRYKVASAQSEDVKFLNMQNKINETTNLSMIIPKDISKVSNSESYNNEPKQYTSLVVQRPTGDNYRKYINLKDVFANEQEETKAPVFVNINKNFLFSFLEGVSKKLTFTLSDLNKFSFNNATLELIDSSNNTIISIDNLYGEMYRKFFGGHYLKGKGRVFDQDMFFNFISNNAKEGNVFNLTASYSNDNFKTKDFILEGNTNTADSIKGIVKISGNALKNIVSTTLFDADFINSKDTSLQGSFVYSSAALKISNIDLVINKIKNKASMSYDFSGKGSLELGINLGISNINDLIYLFGSYEKTKEGNTFSNFNEMLLNWQTHKNNTLHSKFFAVNIQVDHANLNEVPLNNINFNAFFDDNDNLYINNFNITGNEFNLQALGKVQLINKSGTVLINSNGSFNGLCSYIKCQDNLKQLLYATSGNVDNYKVLAKMFLSSDRIVLNDINGNLGNKDIKGANATFVERNNVSELLISSKWDNITFNDLYSVYNFNKIAERTYYNSKASITGIPDNLTINLNLYANTFNFKGLMFNNFQMESSIINSGILVHSFSFNDINNNGSIRGSFNFNSKVSPSIIGNIDFSSALIDMKDLKNVIFVQNNIAGKVIVDGSINISGDNYYNGIDRVNGKISLVQYERSRLNQQDKTEGIFLTVMKLPYQGKDYYQIADLYANINIDNNVIRFTPSVFRYVDGKRNYRGSLDGTFDILRNNINIKSILKSETSNNEKLALDIQGSSFEPTVN